MHHAFKLGDQVHNVELSRSAHAYRLHLGDAVIDIDLGAGPDGRSWLTLDGRHVEVVVATAGDDVFVHLDGEAYQLRYEHPLDRLAAAAAGASEDRILAPMPGSVIRIDVTPGDAVSTGQTLMVIESMKMETTISAPHDGVVGEIAFEIGETFDRDAVLLEIKRGE